MVDDRIISSKGDVYYLMKKYPRKVVVEFECPHEGKKQKHHCDYSKPFSVHLLCNKCHGEKRKTGVNNPNEFDLLIKKFPDNLHKALKSEAIKKGFTLKGYIVALLLNRKAQKEVEKK